MKRTKKLTTGQSSVIYCNHCGVELEDGIFINIL